MPGKHICIISGAFLLLSFVVKAQEPDAKILFSAEYFEQLSAKMERLGEKMIRKSAKATREMRRLEEKLSSKIAAHNPEKAAHFLETSNNAYKNLLKKLQDSAEGKFLVPTLDTIKTCLKFLATNPASMALKENAQAEFKNALEATRLFEERLGDAEEINIFLQQQRDRLKDAMINLGLLKDLKKLNKQAYYFSQQLAEYKEMLKDHRKLQRKVMQMLAQSHPFHEFMKRHSMLATIFRFAGDNGPGNANTALLAGLQTREQINQLLEQRLGISGAGALQLMRQSQGNGQHQAQISNNLRLPRLSRSDNQNSPGFKPNTQRGRPLLKRLEFGANFQSQRASNFFPVTSDIGLFIGYKLNDQSTLGIGAAYKLGWGRSWNNIRLSHQGAGLRSYLDWKLKGQFYATGAYEQNYRSEIRNIRQLRNYSAWQTSGLIGVSKVINVQNGFFKNTRLQLLWDFLSNQQIPRTQPVLFRVGHNF